MKTITPTPEEMEKRVCRFNQLVPVKKQFEAKGIPAAAYEAVAADQTFVMMAPKGHLSATGEEPPIVGGDGGDVVTYNIVTCPPGNGPLRPWVNTRVAPWGKEAPQSPGAGPPASNPSIAFSRSHSCPLSPPTPRA